MKQFNDSVTYIRKGNALPAIVLKSQASIYGELLTLLYANPDSGPGLVVQGTNRGVAAVDSAVKPMGVGAMFGWQENAIAVAVPKKSAAELMDEVQGEVPLGDPNSPHALQPIMPINPTSAVSVENAKADAHAAELAKTIQSNLATIKK